MSLRQAFKVLFKKNSTVKKGSYDFTDEDRVMSAKIRKIKAQTRQVEQQSQLLEAQADLEDMQIELYGEEEATEKGSIWEEALMNILTPLLQKQLGTSDSPNDSAPTASGEPLTDEDIRGVLDGISKKQLKVAKKMPKAVIKKVIQAQTPFSDDEFERAHKIFLADY